MPQVVRLAYYTINQRRATSEESTDAPRKSTCAIQIQSIQTPSFISLTGNASELERTHWRWAALLPSTIDRRSVRWGVVAVGNAASAITTHGKPTSIEHTHGGGRRMRRPQQRPPRAAGPVRLMLTVLVLVLVLVLAEARKQPAQQPAPYKAHFSDFYQASGGPVSIDAVQCDVQCVFVCVLAALFHSDPLQSRGHMQIMTPEDSHAYSERCVRVVHT